MKRDKSVEIPNIAYRDAFRVFTVPIPESTSVTRCA